MGSFQMTKPIAVYVQLLNEGTSTYRPTTAELLPDGRYRLLPTPNYDPEDEGREFLPGSIVRVVQERFAAGEVMVARDL